MTNKIIMGMLVFLTVLSGGLGYYSYTLSQQANSLNEQLATFQKSQTTRINSVNNELAALRSETLISANALQDEISGTLTRIGTLEDKVDDTLNKVDTLEGEVDDTLNKVDTLEDETGETLARIDLMEEEIGGAVAELARVVLDANKVYQRVSQATVQISNGQALVGSGFIFDTQAHVVTAYHVVEDITEIYIVLSDGRISTATIIGSDPYSDIAVLILEDGINIEPPPLADSSMVKIGEPVVTIGNPFDLPKTLTAGVVSQTNRFAEMKYGSQTRWIANLIQFDAAVNFGNSGGPLANSEGEIIGMAIARVNPDLGDGIYYAVSSNKLKRVVAAIISQGYFDYPRIGIGIADLTPQMARARGLETTNGILVRNVFIDSPAEAAGIEVDDILVAIDGIRVNNVADLTSYLGEYKSPGESATIELRRGTAIVELSMEIGSRS